jgi:hypothetical protein
VVKPEGARSIRGLQAKGKTGRVNVSEPLFDASSSEAPPMGCGSGVRTGRCEAAGADWWDPNPVGGHRRSRGIGGALPGRVSLVWNVTIPLGSGPQGPVG